MTYKILKMATPLILSAVCALAAVPSAQATTINPAFEYASAGTLTDDRPFTLGFSFTLSATTDINALGYNTVGFVADQQVGIWDSSGNLLTSATVLTTDPVVGHFAWADDSFTLAAGTYTIGGTYEGGPFVSDLAGVTTIPTYTYVTDEQLYGSGLNDPTTSTGGGYGANGIAQVDFSVNSAAVPEPASWALMLTGFGLVGFTLRNRAKFAGQRAKLARA